MIRASVVRWFMCLAVTGLFVLPAHAGIIITEGKIADEQEPTKEASANTGRRVVATEKSAEGNAGEDEDGDSTPTCTELDEDGFCIQVDSSVDDVSLKEVGDLNNDDPDGWDCTPVGGGIEVCEQPGGTGSSPGAGAGGGLGLEGPPTVGGCQGGQAGTSWLAVLALLCAAVLRRRTTPVGPQS